jgi:hypothetical protein
MISTLIARPTVKNDHHFRVHVGAFMELKQKVKVRGHHILFTDALATRIEQWDGKKSGSFRAQEFSRWETFSKTHETCLFPVARGQAATTIFGYALVYDVKRRTPASITDEDMKWEGFSPTPSTTDFIASWLKGSQPDRDTFNVNKDGKITTHVIFSFRMKVFPIETEIPEDLDHLSLLWYREAHQEVCACCSLEVEVDDGESEACLCFECGCHVHRETCSVVHGKDTVVCKLCNWVINAEKILQSRDKDVLESKRQEALESTLRSVDSTSPSKIRWSNHLRLRASTLPKHPNIYCAPQRGKQIGAKTRYMLCYYSVVDLDTPNSLVYQGQQRANGHFVITVFLLRPAGIHAETQHPHVLTVDVESEDKTLTVTTLQEQWEGGAGDAPSLSASHEDLKPEGNKKRWLDAVLAHFGIEEAPPPPASPAGEQAQGP